LIVFKSFEIFRAFGYKHFVLFSTCCCTWNGFILHFFGSF
jgi:hypothetical protein